MNKRSKRIFWLYWLLCLFNIFGWHRLYWQGIKSIWFFGYVFFNLIYLRLSYIWSKDSGLNIWIKLLTILIYAILFICQILDINLISSHKVQGASENSVKQSEEGEGQNQMLELTAEILPKQESEHAEYNNIFHTPTKNKSEPSQKQIKTREEESQQSLGTERKKTKMLNAFSSSNVIQFPTQSKSVGGSQEFSQKEEDKQIKGDLILDLLKETKKEMTLIEIAQETSYTNDIELLQISLNVLETSGIKQKQGANGEALYFYNPDN